MKAKDKAEELIEKFYYNVSDIPEYNHSERAIACALICTQEMIEEAAGTYGSDLKTQYWLDVEQHIKQFKDGE